MPPTRIIPGATELRQMLAAGMTHREIAEVVYRRTGKQVTRGAVSTAISRAGLSRPKPRYSEHLPWKVKEEHTTHYAARMLRLMARRDGGRTLSPEEESRLQSWLERLRQDNAVVAYVPETEEGFFYVDPPKRYQRPPCGAPIISQSIKIRDIEEGKVTW